MSAPAKSRSLKELSASRTILSPGHRLCAGCGASIVLRQLLTVAPTPVVVGCATGCLEVATTIYPYTAWNCSFIHSAFENVAATMSGVEAAYRALRRQGKIADELTFIAIGGDGGTYDIGIQSLSGMLERGHRVVYVCYDNGAYMNTGVQRSSATPLGADTTTTPVSRSAKVTSGAPPVAVNGGSRGAATGKADPRKDLLAIVAAHGVPYAAQASPSHWRDLTTKAAKAFSSKGPSFLNLLAPCPRGWRYDTSKTIEMTRLAVETCFWPLVEIEDGQWRITFRPKEKQPLRTFLQSQGRFKHLFTEANQELLKRTQIETDKAWDKLQVLEVRSRSSSPGTD
jgi:pyruvate ferredoxin oxidoreductase beta subunit